jgi:hypothetical protein
VSKVDISTTRDRSTLIKINGTIFGWATRIIISRWALNQCCCYCSINKCCQHSKHFVTMTRKAPYNICLTSFCIWMPVNAILSKYRHSLKARTQQFVMRSRNLSQWATRIIISRWALNQCCCYCSINKCCQHSKHFVTMTQKWHEKGVLNNVLAYTLNIIFKVACRHSWKSRFMY